MVNLQKEYIRIMQRIEGKACRPEQVACMIYCDTIISMEEHTNFLPLFLLMNLIKFWHSQIATKI
jgi:hypothetical protein